MLNAPTMPVALKELQARHYERYCEACSRIGLEPARFTESFVQDVQAVFALSDFVAETFIKAPLLPVSACAAGYPALTQSACLALIREKISLDMSLDNLKKQLRLLRTQQTSLIIWRFFLGHTDLHTHLQELTLLADNLVTAATNYLQHQLIAELGTPVTKEGHPINFLIIALGKLGGKELNFSSDIDLIFAYSDKGAIQGEGGNSPISLEAYFTKLARQVIAVLSENTADQFVYRVDMRLRPYGDSGALVYTLDQLEQYYQYQGRDWERYALIKARLIYGAPASRARLQSIIQPFVYRRYLDYGAFDALREMKEKVALDVRRNNREQDIKLGSGGIRQIEFIAQAFQLIQGGKSIPLQHSNLLRVLVELQARQIIDSEKASTLIAAYHYYRKLEHYLQMIHDDQTHQLPNHPIDQARVAMAMGVASYEDCLEDLNKHQRLVSYYFDMLAAVPSITQPAWVKNNPIVHRLWTANTISDLSDIPLPEEFFEKLYCFKTSALIRNLKEKAKKRLDNVMPVILGIIINSASPIILLERTLKFLRAIVRRSAYLVFLIEKEGALEYLLRVFEKSDWITEQLCQHPVLLDEIFTPRTIAQIHSKKSWMDQLSLKLQGVKEDDLELQMEKLREFKLAGFINIALHEILNSKKIDVSKALNHLVETILQQTYVFGLQFLVKQYRLKQPLEELVSHFPFAIIAYGKLGAKELTYVSDLDLVFLYDNAYAINEEATWDKEIFIRLAQRIIHMLSTPTLSGSLFDIDIRLRPGGSAGMLATSLEGFKKYLNNQAWIWEHQALVNARFIVGADSLQEKFQQLRQDMLSYPRNERKLKKIIFEMRDKLMQHKSNDEPWHIKAVPGGLIDIEFIAQLGVLYFAYQQPHLTQAYGTMAILDALREEPYLSQEQIDTLRAAYQYYQFLQNNRLLQLQDKFSTQTLHHYQDKVRTIWDNLFNQLPLKRIS